MDKSREWFFIETMLALPPQMVEVLEAEMRFKGKHIDGKPAADWPAIKAEIRKHERFVIEVTKYDENREISAQQIKWWKGVLLPALAKDNGESVAQWETRLKLNVMPDEFDIQTVKVHGVPVSYIPSIKILSIKKSKLLVEGSVAHLRDETVYGDKYQWVTLPNPDLKK